MGRMKTFATYIIIIILFFIISRVLIFIGLNNTYNNITLEGSIPEGIYINSSKATSVNGEIKGSISSKDSFNGKYIKFNFYSDIDSLAGSYFITPSELENENFEFYFKLNYINSYSIEITDEKPEQASLDTFSTTQYKGTAIVAALIVLMFI